MQYLLKITVCALGAQKRNVNFLETGLIGQTDLTILFSIQQPTVVYVQQSISFPRQRSQGESHISESMRMSLDPHFRIYSFSSV